MPFLTKWAVNYGRRNGLTFKETKPILNLLKLKKDIGIEKLYYHKRNFKARNKNKISNIF